ncbi:MAG: DUF4199 domain-containing protein [Bacteroidales bacterium]|nr:DUF4199 domain-containing protein [Bacteroidales bacterium]
MEKKPNAFVVSLGYGVILALALIVFSLILFLLELQQKSWLAYLSYVILLIGIILAQINFRNKHLGGYIEYGKAFMIGLLTSLVVAIIMGIYTYVFFKYIDPGAMEEAMTLAEQKMMESGLSDMDIEQGMSMVRKFQAPGIYTIFAVLGNFIIGIVFSLITAIFIKKENPGFDQPVA